METLPTKSSQTRFSEPRAGAQVGAKGRKSTYHLNLSEIVNRVFSYGLGLGLGLGSLKGRSLQRGVNGVE